MLNNLPALLILRKPTMHVYKLHKALYGLKQAPRAWYKCLTNFLIEKVSWERTPMGQGPFRSGREQRSHEERIEAEHASDFTQLRSSPER